MDKLFIFFLCFFSLSCKDDGEQNIAPYLECEKTDLTFTNAAQTYEMGCNTNGTQLDFSFDQDGSEWCSVKFDSEKKKLLFTVSDNKSIEVRKTKLTVVHKEAQENIQIYQTGVAPVLELHPSALEVVSQGGRVKASVVANVEYEIASELPAWVKMAETENDSASLYQFDIERNGQADVRSAEITFRQKGGNLSQVLKIVQQGNKYTALMVVPFGKMGFIEPLENSTYAKKTAQGIRNWNNEETVIKFFVNVADQPQTDDSLFMQVKGHAHEDVNIELKINDQITKVLNIKSGDFLMSLPAFVPPSSNYQCISFKGMDPNKRYPDLDSMRIQYRPGLTLNYNTSNYGAPAVHLSYSADGNNVEWSMGEVMIKPEACRPDMYYMVSGFDGGYSGIQVSADFDLADPRGNTFLFSVWSDYKTQDPSQIPDHYQPWTDEIRKGGDMRDEGFGNEGSGVHANWFYKWKPNVIYKFLIHMEKIGTVRRNGKDYPNCNAYTCWLYVPELGGWQFYVRYIRPNDKRTSLGLPGSFVENPSGTHSSSKYRGYYRHWVRYYGGTEWVALKQANFGTTGANDEHPRYDVGIGKETIEDENGYGGEFCYIFSGGFTVNTGKAGLKETLNFTEMPAVDLEALPSLDTFDNLMEGDTREGVERPDRANWTATASSEEIGGPYEDGYARFAIDGNTGTFWHTKYTGEKPVYPHWICIDMQEMQVIDGFYIQPRGRDVTKDFKVEISEDNSGWTEVGTFILGNNGNEQKFSLSSQVSARYLRITCLNGYNSNPFTSISEIGVYRNK